MKNKIRIKSKAKKIWPIFWLALQLCHCPQPTNRICFSIHLIKGIRRNTEYWTKLSSKRLDEGGWVPFWFIPMKKVPSAPIRIEMVDFFNRKLISISRTSILLYRKFTWFISLKQLNWAMDPKFIAWSKMMQTPIFTSNDRNKGAKFSVKLERKIH